MEFDLQCMEGWGHYLLLISALLEGAGIHLTRDISLLNDGFTMKAFMSLIKSRAIAIGVMEDSI